MSIFDPNPSATNSMRLSTCTIGKGSESLGLLNRTVWIAPGLLIGISSPDNDAAVRAYPDTRRHHAAWLVPPARLRNACMAWHVSSWIDHTIWARSRGRGPLLPASEECRRFIRLTRPLGWISLYYLRALSFMLKSNFIILQSKSQSISFLLLRPITKSI